MGESVFELLFKYRPLVWERGELAFTLPAPWLMALGLALAAVAVVTYVRARGRAGGADRLALGGIRLALLAVVLILLARPVLLISRVVPQQNYLGVLVDDSRSMRIDDGASRAGIVDDLFLDAGAGLRTALERRFRVRLYRFSDAVARVGATDTLDFAGTGTRLGRALESVRDELGSLPLTGLVVVSDGADQDPEALEAATLPLKAAGVPVFTVGVGSERFERDIEVARVSVPDEVIAGSAALAEVVLEHGGYRGRTVPVVVEREGRIVGQREVRLGDDGGTTVQVDFETGEGGPAVYRFRVPVQEGELVERNNERVRSVRVRAGPEKILYFEGEPRHEVAFLRRAVADDPALQLVLLQRSDENRYLRLDVDSAAELIGGFPRTRAELFSYRGLVLGSVEASHFTLDQLAMIEEFVAERGGGLLMLGGRNALAEGGWAGTPVAGALPVVLDPTEAADSLFYAETRVVPTRYAAADPITRMEEDAAVIPWADLPGLTVYNRVGATKPGATVLLEATSPALPTGQPVLAHQRYGAGRAAVFGVQDSWIWQMHADVPPEDQTHERLWRQLLRWLASGTPDRVAAQLPPEPGSPGSPLEIGARVRDARFAGANGAAVTAVVTSPAGEVSEIPLRWDAGRDGEYRGRFTPDALGSYTVEVRSESDGLELRGLPARLEVEPSTAEYFGAAMRRGSLERLALETGGRFYTTADVGRLAEDLTYTERGATVVEELDLWDMPAAFLLILVLISLEWMYRRRRGLA